MASPSKAPPKGILKMSAPTQSEPSAENEPSARNREIALEHANILQNRKALEAQILESLIILSEYPLERTPPHSAANPAPSDIADFKAHVRLFQPSDYDDLIIERNVNELCGYSLCGRPRRQMGAGGDWKITGGNIVKRKDLEMWCSQQCARRALYVKVQLNETAAWERAGIPDIEIDLLDEDKSAETEADRTARKLGELKLEDQRQAAKDTASLAMERGQPKAMLQDKVKVTLMEKETGTPKPSPGASEVYEDDHLVVEGYKSKIKTERESQIAR